ncbi:rhodanese-like domain-containing protein [Motiliproteus sediminis]|uniref:rhodanese-like domain-containing protein n=1 Tax=Motiliproteus sediminis TaxID=1468178 RepID=UPI001AEF7125|nr:rhodanese-like domain-containing protein [Motiliproteus sediminis]
MSWFKMMAVSLLMLSTVSAQAGEREQTALDKVAGGALLIDVRTPGEFAQGHLDGAANIPYPQIVDALFAKGVAKDREIVVYCRSGNRSGIAEGMLRDAGYSAVFNGGGLNALQRQQATRP